MTPQNLSGNIHHSRLAMRRLIQEIRSVHAHKSYGLQGNYPEIFARKWNFYRGEMAMVKQAMPNQEFWG